MDEANMSNTLRGEGMQPPTPVNAAGDMAKETTEGLAEVIEDGYTVLADNAFCKNVTSPVTWFINMLPR
jgi:hypothetical protein